MSTCRSNIQGVLVVSAFQWIKPTNVQTLFGCWFIFFLLFSLEFRSVCDDAVRSLWCSFAKLSSTPSVASSRLKGMATDMLAPWNMTTGHVLFESARRQARENKPHRIKRLCLANSSSSRQEFWSKNISTKHQMIPNAKPPAGFPLLRSGFCRMGNWSSHGERETPPRTHVRVRRKRRCLQVPLGGRWSGRKVEVFYMYLGHPVNHQKPCFWYLKNKFFGGEHLWFSWFWVLLVETVVL